MPLYEYRCRECEQHFDVYRSIEQRHDHGGCPQCDSDDCVRVFTPLGVIADIDPYRSTITGEVITSRTKHKQHLKQHGYEEVGTDNFDEAKDMFHKPPPDDKDRINDVVDAYDQLANT